MFNHINRTTALVLLGMLSASAQADDLDIYAGATVTGSATPELLFAIDTSQTMGCALGQKISVEMAEDDVVKCYVNTHPHVREKYGATFDAQFGTTGYQIPNNVKIDLVRGVMANVLSDNALLPDDVKVGMAFYNDPGGSIVRPMKALGEATGNADYTTHRQLLQAELNNVVPNGRTPIMGTLLEIGQYLTSSQVINGKVRMPVQAQIDALDEKGYETSGLYIFPETETFGQTARISHPETVTPESLNYSVNATCEAAVTDDVVTGKGNIACASEALGGDDDAVFYNEDINSASVCGNNADLATGVATTQVVLLSDGLADGEALNFQIGGASMATWVHRFVTGNPNASGPLPQGTINQSADGFPESGQFNDLGCPETAHSNHNIDTVIKKQRFESCLYNVAHRFRELGVKVNVIGFDVLADGLDVDNNQLRKVAEITGGDFLVTTNVGDMQSFITGLASGTIAASELSVPLSPSVAVNPGSILTNTGEVYIPGFQAGNSSFYYGNLKKYQVEVRPTTTDAEGNATGFETVLVGANNSDATEECSVDDDGNETYTCFRSNVRDLWTSPAPSEPGRNYAAVTVGGAAAEQGIYGPDPTNGRTIYIQHGSDDMRQLNLISVGDDPEYGSPDDDALDLSEGQGDIGTKDFYARLVANPNDPGNTFSSFSALQEVATAGAPELLTNAFAHDLIRWLNGFDQKRFNEDGEYSAVGQQNEHALLGANAPLVNPSDDLSKSRLYYGAIVHSTPTLVNYDFDRDADGNLVYDNTLYFSGNDGFLRAVDADDGSEVFSFFPEALIPNLSAWYRNTPGKMVYGLDSTWTPWRQDLPDVNGVFDGQINDGADGFVRLYGGMRRGGSSYYFLDVSNRSAPKLLREIKSGNEGFETLGQTWSQPVLARVVKPGDSLPTVVAIFGGGYDPDYDPELPGNADPNCVDTPEQRKICGNQIYMVEAGGYTGQPGDVTDIGDILWWASKGGTSVGFSPGVTMYSAVDNMNHSIPAKVKTLDINDDGYTDRIYVGDLGGQVFRVKINNKITDAASAEPFITIDTLAQVGHEGFDTQTDANNRMFYESPSVAVMSNNNQRYIGVAVASGWRANPSHKDTSDELYFFRDDLDGTQQTLQRPVGSEGTAEFILGAESYAGTPAQLDAARAMAASLDSDGGSAGEKAFGAPVILRSNVFLPIYIPPTDTEVEASLTQCEPPPHRSALVGFRVQSGAEVSFIKDNDGNIVAGTPPEGNVASFFRSDATRSVPFNGLGVHVGNDTVSILAGTQSITLSLPDDRVRKTRWELLDSGENAIPANAVTGPE